MDPVGAGVVASLARPGGNVTGMSIQQTDTAGKRIELLREVVPKLARLAIMANVGAPGAVLEMREVLTTARSVGLEVTPIEVRQAAEIVSAIEALNGRADFALCRDRPAHFQQPYSNQRFGTGRTTIDNLREPGVRRRGRVNVLWAQLVRPISARRRGSQQDSTGNKTG